MLKEFEKLFMDRNAHKSARIKFTALVLQKSVGVALNPLAPVPNCWIPLSLQTFITFCQPVLVQINTCSCRVTGLGCCLRRWLLACFSKQNCTDYYLLIMLAVIILLFMCIFFILDNVS